MASKYRKLFPIPNNFENILSDFAKEVLRTRPKDIIEFGIEYFKALELKQNISYKGPIEDQKSKGQNIINVENKLEISTEDKNRLQRSMDKIDRMNGKEVPIREEPPKTEEIKVQRKEEYRREEREDYRKEEREYIRGKKEEYMMEHKEEKYEKEVRYEREEMAEREEKKEEFKNYQKKEEELAIKHNIKNEEPIIKYNKINLEQKESQKEFYSRRYVRLVDDFDFGKKGEESSNQNDNNEQNWYSRRYIRLAGW